MTKEMMGEYMILKFQKIGETWENYLHIIRKGILYKITLAKNIWRRQIQMLFLNTLALRARVWGGLGRSTLNNPHFEQLPYNLLKHCFDMINSVENKPRRKKAEKILVTVR